MADPAFISLLVPGVRYWYADGSPTPEMMLLWQNMWEGQRATDAGQDDLIAAILAAQTTADTALAVGSAAQTDADAAAAAAAAAQATADAIVVPPTEGRTVTANDTVGPDDAILLCDATAGNITINLPAAAAEYPAFIIRKIDASANTVTVDAAGADTINGAGTIVLTTQYESLTFANNGVNAWFA